MTFTSNFIEQRLLAQEERAEAACQELDWQSSQARKSVLQTEEQDEIEDDPNAGDDDDLEEVHHRNTRKRLRGALCTIINTNQADF